MFDDEYDKGYAARETAREQSQVLVETLAAIVSMPNFAGAFGARFQTSVSHALRCAMECRSALTE